MFTRRVTGISMTSLCSEALLLGTMSAECHRVMASLDQRISEDLGQPDSSKSTSWVWMEALLEFFRSPLNILQQQYRGQ